MKKYRPPSALPGVLLDLSARRAVQDSLFQDSEHAQVTLDSIGDAVLSTDLNGKITYINAVAEKMTGWSKEEAQGQPFDKVLPLVNETTRAPLQRNPMSFAIEENDAVDLAADSVLVRRDGFECAIEDSIAPIHNRRGRIIGAVMVFRDVSAAREAAKKMAHQAQHDSLTNLPNATLLDDRIGQAIALARRNRRQLALLYLDIDRFKEVNDSLGHDAGDLLLQSVADKLNDCVRNSDTVCRKGGDEFVVLISEINHRDRAAHIAKKIIAAVADNHPLPDKALQITVSIGISIYPLDGMDDITLLKSADAAMYQAKANGRNQYCFFDVEMKSPGDADKLFMDSARP